MSQQTVTLSVDAGLRTARGIAPYNQTYSKFSLNTANKRECCVFS
jgi:hypothetical protein